MKKIMFAIVAIFISVCLFIGGSEILIRVYDHIKGVTPPYTHNLPECIAIPSGYFNFDIQPNLKIMYDSHEPRKFSFNRWGFRGPEYDPIKPKGVIRIFCFGGSSTFDPYVSDEKSWSYLVGEKLSKVLGRKVESINAGRYAYTTSEILTLFYFRALRHDPDMIIIYSTYNDVIEISPYFGRDDCPQFYGNPFLGYLNKHSAFFAYFDYKLRFSWNVPFIRDLYVNIFPRYMYAKKIPQEHFEYSKDFNRAKAYIVMIYKRNLRTIIHIARDNNVKILLSTQLIDPEYNNIEKKMITQAMRDVAKEEYVPLLDLDETGIDVKKENLLQTYVHLTPKGCEYVSDKMTEAILKDNLIGN